jgi:hypothetical protein
MMRIDYRIFVILSTCALCSGAANSWTLSDKIIPAACHIFGLKTDASLAGMDAPYQALPDPSNAVLKRLTAVCNAYPKHAAVLGHLNQREQLLFNDYMIAANPHRALLRRASYARLNNWPEEYLVALDVLITLTKDIYI